MTLRGSTLASNMFTYHQRLDVQKLVKVHARLEVEKQKQDIKNLRTTSILSLTNLKDGKWNQGDFDKEKITVLTMLRKKNYPKHSASTGCPQRKM